MGDVSPAEINPVQLAAEIIHKKTEWTRSSWRQNKAAMLLYISKLQEDHPEKHESCGLAVDMLLSESESGCKRSGKTTSSRRNKDVKHSDFDKLITGIKDSRSAYSNVIETWLYLGRLSGLRPHEWCHAKITDHVIDDDGAVISDPQPGPYLRVVNSKHSNNRAHGTYRHLSMHGSSEAVLSAVAGFISFMQDIAANGQYETVYKSCSKALLACNQRIFKDEKKFIQLYSPRHMYSALLKQYFSRIEVAAAMGHSSVDTAGTHYGKRFIDNGGSGLFTPVVHDIKKVMELNTHRLPKNKPTPLSR